MSIHCCDYQAPMGPIIAAAEDDAIIGLWFDGQKYFPTGTERWVRAPSHPALVQLRAWLDGYFRGESHAFPGRISPKGTAFRQNVWQALRRIPYGSTTTYGAIARELAARRGIASISAQAVGGAVGHNPISLVIPCHRVVGVKGALTGYAGGIEKKEAILRLEGICRASA